jgi:hypothetical protein
MADLPSAFTNRTMGAHDSDGYWSVRHGLSGQVHHQSAGGAVCCCLTCAHTSVESVPMCRVVSLSKRTSVRMNRCVCSLSPV